MTISNIFGTSFLAAIFFAFLSHLMKFSALLPGFPGKKSKRELSKESISAAARETGSARKPKEAD